MRKVYTQDKMLLTNNSRRYAGFKPHRKLNRHKRYYTRCNANEAISAFLYYCNNAD